MDHLTGLQQELQDRQTVGIDTQLVQARDALQGLPVGYRRPRLVHTPNHTGVSRNSGAIH